MPQNSSKSRTHSSRSKPRVLLTGAAGFIGSCFLWKLNSLGMDDAIIVDVLDKSEKWKNLLGKRFDDYLGHAALLELIAQGKLNRRINAVVHLGACSSTTETDSHETMVVGCGANTLQTGSNTISM